MFPPICSSRKIKKHVFRRFSCKLCLTYVSVGYSSSGCASFRFVSARLSLERHYLLPYYFQSSFRRVSEQFCGSFRAFLKRVSEQFQGSFRAVLEQLQCSFRAVLEQFEKRVSDQFQSSFKRVSEHLKKSFRAV